MANITPFLTAKTAIGVAIETTPGTFVVPAKWVPVSSAKIEDAYKFFEDKAYRGLAAESYGHYRLGGNGVLQYTGPHYPDASSYWWKGIMGQHASTAAPTSTTTTGTNSANATTLTITSGTGFVNGMGILINTGLLQEGSVILSGGGTATLTLAMPLRNTHTAGATVAGNNMHTFTMAPNASVAQVPSLSIFDSYVESQRDLPNSVVEELIVKWTADSEATYDVKLVSNLTNTDSTRAASYTQIPPFVGWQVGSLIAGTLQNNVQDFEVALKRKVAVIFASNNQQGPVAILSTTLMVTGKVLFVMKDEAELNHFLNSDNPKLQFALAGPAPGQSGAVGASGLLINMQNSQFIKAPIERGKDYVEVVADFAADYNATDAGPIQVFLTNSYASL